VLRATLKFDPFAPSLLGPRATEGAKKRKKVISRDYQPANRRLRRRLGRGKWLEGKLSSLVFMDSSIEVAITLLLPAQHQEPMTQ
ncbi:MAG: hypothetical protein ACK5V3_12030, partial [Bdellovibrionales bacterium]